MSRQFRAARLRQAVVKDLMTPSPVKTPTPPWFEVISQIPPPEILTRPIPVQHQPANPRMTKPRKTFRPQRITYEEDELRQTFFRDHPWELARPRMLVEFDGKDSRRLDWSRGLRQPGTQLSGECVVQRQLWMMHNVPGITKEQAYDTVRREFYRLRQEEEVERRVAQEEARMVGAYFGKTTLQVGMQLEDRQYEFWKRWAAAEIEKGEAAAGESYTMFGDEIGAEDEGVDGEAGNL